jgi:hypothetical protein
MGVCNLLKGDISIFHYRKDNNNNIDQFYTLNMIINSKGFAENPCIRKESHDEMEEHYENNVYDISRNSDSYIVISKKDVCLYPKKKLDHKVDSYHFPTHFTYILLSYYLSVCPQALL